MEKNKNIFKQFLKENRMVFIYAAIAAPLELVSQFFVDAKPYFAKFWVNLLLIAVIITFLFWLKGLRLKRRFALFFLLGQIVIIIAAAYLYYANGSAFQKEMLSQRSDAFGTIEQFNFNIWLVLICIAALILYIMLMRKDRKRFAEKKPVSRMSKKMRVGTLTVSIICVFLFCISPILTGVAEKRESNYHYKLTSSQGDGNQMMGITANFLYELLKFSGSSGVNLDNLNKIEEFIYSEPCDTSRYHGISKDNNLVVILVESLDTHVFERYTDEKTALIFPNITKLKNQGIYGANFRQKEKTDTSEIISLLSGYPTEKYVNYSYTNNSYPFSLPNLFKQSAGDNGDGAQVLSFHQNKGSMYNRDELHKALGFERLVSIDEMVTYGMVNAWDGPLFKGERSLDSLTVQTMKDVMFPSDKQFFSYWITFTMHGFYEERENLKKEGYYDILDGYKLFPAGTKEENHWRTYAAAVMDFDRSIGIMMQDLEDKGILDKTTIAIMSDHNTYYNSLTSYAKKLDNHLDPEGFRLPFILYDQKLVQAFKENGESTTITKFITTADLLPTICDLFGIKAWKNLYFGTTIFNSDVESIVYSRIYNFFFNDKLSFYNRDNLYYTSTDFTQKDLTDFLARAEVHLDRLYYLDKIFYCDYFKNNVYMNPSESAESV